MEQMHCLRKGEVQQFSKLFDFIWTTDTQIHISSKITDKDWNAF